MTMVPQTHRVKSRLAEGNDVILRVHPEGWEEPLELRFHL